MNEYLGQAIDILRCQYTNMGSESSCYIYSAEQVMWALEVAIPVLEKVWEEGND